MLRLGIWLLRVVDVRWPSWARNAVSWFRNVYVAALEDRPQPVHPAMTVDEVTDDTLEPWLAVLRFGNEMTTPDAAAISDEWARACRGVAGAKDYLAYLRRNRCGLRIGHCRIRHRLDRRSHDNSGLPAARSAGRARPAAHDNGVRVGCDLAVVTAVPSGDSARNVARLGFTLAYCQAVLTKMAIKPAAGGRTVDNAPTASAGSAECNEGFVRARPQHRYRRHAVRFR